MLVWALWLALSMVRWLHWGWKCFSGGGFWKKSQRIKRQEAKKEGSKAIPEVSADTGTNGPKNREAKAEGTGPDSSLNGQIEPKRPGPEEGPQNPKPTP
jgi:hypothetical protein